MVACAVASGWAFRHLCHQTCQHDHHPLLTANSISILLLQKGSPYFLYSDNLWTAAEEAGLWSPQDGVPLDFAAVRSEEEEEEEEEKSH